MTESLSIWTLMSEATLLVQGVMLILVLASLVSWVMIVQRFQLITAARRELDAFEEDFWSGADLREIYREVTEREDGALAPGAEQIFVAGFREFSRLGGASADPDDVLQGVQRAMRVALSREEERLAQNLPFLATVGSTSPYVGLFGTVWDHEFLSPAGHGESGLPGHGRAGDFRGPHRYGHGALRRHSRGGGLQPLFHGGGWAHGAL